MPGAKLMRRGLLAMAALPLLVGAGMPAAPDVVVVVSAASRITEIPRLHLVDLFMGRTSRFPDGAPAVPVDQRPGSADRAAFSSAFLGRSEAQVKAHWAKIIFTGRGRPPVEAASGEAVRTMVAADPQAIGYLDRKLIDASVRVVRVR